MSGPGDERPKREKAFIDDYTAADKKENFKTFLEGLIDEEKGELKKMKKKMKMKKEIAKKEEKIRKLEQERADQEGGGGPR